MARILSRAAGRLITGPLAFLLAGLIDLAVFGLRSFAQRN
jgi:hypothetical protein